MKRLMVGLKWCAWFACIRDESNDESVDRDVTLDETVCFSFGSVLYNVHGDYLLDVINRDMIEVDCCCVMCACSQHKQPVIH